MVSTTSLTSSSESAGSSAATASKVTFSTSGDSAAGAAAAFDAVADAAAADVLFSGGVTNAGSSFAALDVFELGVTLFQGLVIYKSICWRKNEKRTVAEKPAEIQKTQG
jgi:hypothetical protein